MLRYFSGNQNGGVKLGQQEFVDTEYTLILMKVNLTATQASYEFGFAIILLIFASLSNMDDTDNEFPFLLLCLVLTWDVVDGNGEDQEDNSSPAASCM